MRRSLHPILLGGRFEPSKVFRGGAKGLWLDQGDISTGFTDSAGTTAQTASGDATGRRSDKSGRGNHLLQSTAAARPTYTVSSGVAYDLFDGTDDGYITAAFSAGTLSSDMDCFIAIKRTSAAKGVLGHLSSGTAGFAVYNSAEAVAANFSAGSPTYAVNGVAVAGGASTTRQQLDSAIPNGSWAILEVRNLDLSAWADLGIGAFPGFPVAGQIAGYILCQAQTATRRDSIRRWLGSRVGLSL